MRSAVVGVAACLAASLGGAAWAQDLKATPKYTDAGIGFELGGRYTNFTLTVTGPYGMHARASSKSEVPSINLKDIGATEDGAYNYELTASTDDKVPLRYKLDNGRDGGPETVMAGGASTSGRFDVKGGAVVKYDPAAKEPVTRQK